MYYRTQNPNRFRHLSQWLTIWVILMNHFLQSFCLLLVEQQIEMLFWVTTPPNWKGKKLQTKVFLLVVSACCFVVAPYIWDSHQLVLWDWEEHIQLLPAISQNSAKNIQLLLACNSSPFICNDNKSVIFLSVVPGQLFCSESKFRTTF